MIFIKKPIGVINIKKIIPITIGETTIPNNFPNSNHNLLKGYSNFELNIPKTKKIEAKIIDQILMFPSSINGHRPIKIKTRKNTIPKFRFELIFILDLYDTFNKYYKLEKTSRGFFGGP
tara:strand:+ start:233 stop:589 length:357 start_codon:yes stop_codon:yes gene_type:complete